MNLVDVCKLLGLELGGYDKHSPFLLDKWQFEELLTQSWNSHVIEFSHDCSVTVDHDFLEYNGLVGSVVLTLDAVGEELDILIWQYAAEQFKEKLGKAVEFGGKL
jgi:hypothetical protein